MGSGDPYGGGGFVIDEEPADPHYDARAGGFGGGSCCENCGCLSYSQEYYNAFNGVMVCQGCLSSRLPQFELIPKGTAKDQYLLTDKDLKRLGFITKRNPQHKQWSDMKLYLRSQVEEVARRKHGSLTDLQEAKQAKVQARLAQRVERSKRSHSDMQGPDTEHEHTDPHVPTHPTHEPQHRHTTHTAPLNPIAQRVRARLEKEYQTPQAPVAGASAGSSGHVQLDPAAQHAQHGAQHGTQHGVSAGPRSKVKAVQTLVNKVTSRQQGGPLEAGTDAGSSAQGPGGLSFGSQAISHQHGNGARGVRIGSGAHSVRIKEEEDGGVAGVGCVSVRPVLQVKPEPGGIVDSGWDVEEI